MLLFQLAVAATEPPLPPSFNEARLSACAPTTLKSAEVCLRKGLSKEDLAIVEDRLPARQFRPGLDMAIERAWRLRDPNSPMAKAMRGLMGLDRSDIASGLIISDLQVRATTGNGSGLDFEAIRQAFKLNPPPPETPHV
ncbi:MAG: hypothetical protein QOH04_1763, partial [Sphingomonadales bacterium]|nr:hypothetical protein [Sphingomonadales bacterium]